MITRIEIDGFKTFRNFVLEFAPFQIIVGANGAGKSNLFDALRLVSYLADFDLRSAFQKLRGEIGELFTILPERKSTDQIQLAVEMLIDRQVQDEWGGSADLKYTRLRYELEIAHGTDNLGIEQLYVKQESLVPIKKANDAWLKKYRFLFGNRVPKISNYRKNPFIETKEWGLKQCFIVHTDIGGRGKKQIEVLRLERTLLSGITETMYAHAFAVRKEMRTWKFLQLNPEVLRQSSLKIASPFIAADGSNLPAALARMAAEDEFIINDISRDLVNLVPGILNIKVEEDERHNRYLIYAHTQDGRVFSSQVLSDGTLRILALVSFKHDPEHRGVLCFEEPENGVHPFRLKNLVETLQDLATDLSDLKRSDEPLRQLLVNTHSPVLLNQLGTLENLLFAHMITEIDPENLKHPLRFTHVVPISYNYDPNKDEEGKWNNEEKYSLHQIIKYLNTGDASEMLTKLSIII